MRCPACGERFRLRLRNAVPRYTDGPDLSCPRCGCELEYPRRLKLAWHAGFVASALALMAASQIRHPYRQPLAWALAVVAMALASAVLFPFWRVVPYVPSSAYPRSQRFAAAAAVIAGAALLLWLFARFVYPAIP